MVSEMPTYRAYKIVNMYTTKDIEADNEGQARAIALNDLGAVDKIEILPPPPPPPVEPPLANDVPQADTPISNDSGFDNGGVNNS